MKNFFCNIPMYVGILVLFLSHGIKKLSEKLMEMSFTLHMKFDTEAGKKLKDYEQYVKSQVAKLKEAQQDGQLARIILGKSNGKRPTDH